MLHQETLTEKLIKKGFWLYFFSFLIAPSWYVIRLLISNDLSVAEVWVIYSIIWLVALLSNYNDLGFTESLNYFLPKFWINKEYDKFKSSIFIAFFMQTITAILIAIWLRFFSDWIGQNYFHSIYASKILKVFSLFFVIFNILKTTITILNAFQDTFRNKLIEFARMWSIALFCLFLFFTDTGNVLNYSLAWFLWTLIATILGILVIFKKYNFLLKKWKIVFSWYLIKQIFSYAIWVVVAIQWWILLWNIDQQMVIYFLWPQQAGYYTNYLSLLTIYSLFIWPIFWFLFPVTTELATRKEIWKLNLMLSIFYKYFTVIWLIIWIFFALSWPFVAYVLFWKKFITSGQLLKLGGWFIFINILIAINFNILAGLWKIKERVKIIWIAAIWNLIWNFFAIKFLWLKGAILTTIIWWFLMVGLSYREIIKSWVKIKFDWKFWIKNLIWLWSFWILLWRCILKLNFDLSRLYIFIVLASLWIIFLIFMLILNFKEFKLFVKEIKQVVRKWV